MANIPMNKVNEDKNTPRRYRMYGNINLHLLFDNFHNEILDHRSSLESCNYTKKVENES